MTPVQPDRFIAVHENTDVAAARRAASSIAVKAGFDEHDTARVAVIATEAASNLLKHAKGGDLILRDVSSPAAPRLEILAVDRGKGMSNPSRCFEDGYSTAGSPGTGLGAIARASQLFELYSALGSGTVLLSVSNAAQSLTRRAATEMAIGAINSPYPGEEVSGDVWTYSSQQGKTRILLADGLGHGILASDASRAALPCVDDPRNIQPLDVIEDANIRLKPTRGAAVGVAEVDFEMKTLLFAGMGNIVAAIIAPSEVKQQLISMNGTVGHETNKARQFEYPFELGSLLIMHSDGLSTHWGFDKYPGLFQKHPSVIAGVLFRDFRRTRDDATVVVARGPRA